MSATDIIIHLETIEGAHRSGNLHDHPGTTERGPDCAVAQWLRDAIDWIRAADLTKAGPAEHYQCRVCMDTFVTREGREIHETLKHDLVRSADPDSANREGE